MLLWSCITGNVGFSVGYREQRSLYSSSLHQLGLLFSVNLQVSLLFGRVILNYCITPIILFHFLLILSAKDWTLMVPLPKVCSERAVSPFLKVMNKAVNLTCSVTKLNG